MRISSDSPSRGLSYIEFVIVAPVVLLIIFGMVEVGRLLSNHIWFSRAATQVATLGSITGVDSRKATMLRYATDLLSTSGGRISDIAAVVDTDPATNRVYAELTARVTPLVWPFPVPIRARSEMAVLLTREFPLGDLSWSQNPPQFYNCNGQPLRVNGGPCTYVGCALTLCP